MKLATLLSFFGLAAAVPSGTGLNRHNERRNESPTRRLLIGAPGKIIAADFDGSKFSVVSSTSQEEGAVFSWLLFNDTSSVIYAVDENSNNIHVYDYNPEGGEAGTFVPQGTKQGATGVVHLELNEAGNRMVASAYGSHAIQVWDTTQGNSINLLGNVTSNIPGALTQESTPHQAVRHPSRPFFVVNDLGTDAILVIDARNDDEYTITSRIPVKPGCGPRHGVFPQQDGSEDPAYYTVLCEKGNELLTYKLSYDTEGTIDFSSEFDTISTFDSDPPEGAAAGEILRIKDDIYVSNRLTGKPEDSIARFTNHEGKLALEDTFSSKANNPRMISASEDEEFIYVANMENSKGLHAFRRKTDGTVQEDSATFADLGSQLEDDNDPTSLTGPQFVKEIATK